MLKSIYEQNLDAIKKIDIELYGELCKIKENIRYEVFQDKNKDDINIVDTKENIKFYNNPIEDIQKEIEYFERYSEYDFLYIYGIGTGVVVKKLLENKKHQQIVIVEPNIELLYIALNLIDYSDDILSNRLTLMLADTFMFHKVINLLIYRNADLYVRVFKLHVISSYYNQIYTDKMLDIHKIFVNALEYAIQVAGNSTVDQVLGLKQHMSNISLMLKGPKLSSLRGKRNSSVAIVVSTGPSLHKQLSLLKEIKDSVTIISADASMPILEKNSIKPDFVVSMERDEDSDIFHKKTSKEFQKDVNFICASLQNKNVFKAIKSGTKVLSMRPFPYNAYLELDDYGYVCSGMSSGNMAYELAVYMGYKTIIFIGQDLAYGEDGSSHSKEHVLGEDFIKDGKMKMDNPVKYEEVFLEAYGGKGKVKSILPWKMFLSGLVYSVQKAGNFVMSINSTEGGARINGTIEIPFKEAVEKHVDKAVKKEKIILENTDIKEYKLLKLACDKKIEELIEGGEKLQKSIEDVFLFISRRLEKIENKSIEEIINTYSMTETVDMLDKVNNLRAELEESEIFKAFYYDILKSVIVSYELELAEVKVSKVTSKEENQLKAVRWINSHRTWMFDLAGGIWNVLEILKKEYIMGLKKWPCKTNCVNPKI